VFLSLQKTKAMFENMQLGFLIVGHMDENVNGIYGYLSKKLKKQNICVGRLNEVFMVS
jgi:hypothetical protein